VSQRKHSLRNKQIHADTCRNIRKHSKRSTKPQELKDTCRYLQKHANKLLQPNVHDYLMKKEEEDLMNILPSMADFME
jgi:hypothetical protein